jgi:hypothetical protein
MFRILVLELRAWMATTLGEMTVATMVEAFLLARGKATMLSCLRGTCNDFHMSQSAVTALDGIV